MLLYWTSPWPVVFVVRRVETLIKSDWKHWYQDEDRRYDKTGAVVLAQFRNVYDWTESMRVYPHHAPIHFFLEWQQFVTTPWTMPRYGEDIAFHRVNKNNCPHVTCRYGRNNKPYELVPCLANNTYVFTNWDNKFRYNVGAYYELRRTSSRHPKAKIYLV